MYVCVRVGTRRATPASTSPLLLSLNEPRVRSRAQDSSSGEIPHQAATSTCGKYTSKRNSFQDSRCSWSTLARQHNVSEQVALEEYLLAKQPSKRWIEVEEVARMALYLVGPGSGGVNGAALSIDGGWLAA